MIRYYNGDYGFPAGNPAGMQNAYQVAGSPSFDIPGGASPYRFPFAPGEDPEKIPRFLVPRPDQKLFPVPSTQRMLPQAMGVFQGGVPMGNAAVFPGGQLINGIVGKTLS